MYCRKTGASLGDRIDDMAQHLALTATRRALNYKPELNPNSSFTSYLWDIMEPACIDYFRRKAEGHGDRRYGHDNRIDLAGEDIHSLAAVSPEDPALERQRFLIAEELDELEAKIRLGRGNNDAARVNELKAMLEEVNSQRVSQRWRYAAFIFQQVPYCDWSGVNEKRTLYWLRAADIKNLPIDVVNVRVMDVWARSVFEEEERRMAA
jgi:hypothetical protein